MEQVTLSPAVAARLKRALEWVERQYRNPTAPPEGGPPTTPRLKIGKATATIPARQFGPCDIYMGAPGSETNLNLSPAVQCFNATEQYITAQKWLGIVGQYIVVCLNPARDVWGTYNGSTVTVTDYANGDNPGTTLGSGGSFTVSVDSTAGSNPPKSGADVRCLWHDRNQAYVIVSWSC